MGILASQKPVGKECPTYVLGFRNALASGFPCNNAEKQPEADGMSI
jgi:hypothetical protein